MCFSASASFTASIVLGAAGLIALSKNKDKNMRLFSAIPLLFSLQQAFEGLVWISFRNPESLQLRSIGTHGFLFFAFILWPAWVPLSLYRMEPPGKRKQILLLCFSIGIICATALLLGVLKYGITTELYDHHILYTSNISEMYILLSSMLYLVATIVPFFISSKNNMALFGFLLAISYLVSYLFYYQVFVSIWCFFAAILSCLVLGIVI